jgi:hypothetical protein
MVKIIISAAVIACLAASPALAQVTSETRFNSTFGRPDEKTNYSVNQSFRLKEGNSEYRFTTGVVVVHDDNGDRTYIPVKLGVTTNLDKSTTLTLLGGADTVLGERTAIAGSVGLQSRVSPDLRLGLNVESKAVLDNPKSIDIGIRTVSINPFANWRIDNKTRLTADYKLGFINDGNTSHTVNARLERSLGSGFYSAANVYYYSVAKDLDNGYWTPGSYVLAGLETGARFPVSKTLGVQVGIQPSYINNQGDQKLGIGGGVGARWQASKDSTVELWVRGGYGVSAGGSVRVRL